MNPGERHEVSADRDEKPAERPARLEGGIRDLGELCEIVRDRVATAMEQREPLTQLTDPPFVTRSAMVFMLRCDLAVIVVGVAAVVVAGFSLAVGLSLGALAAVAFVLRWLVKLTKIAPARRRLRSCRVVPAVVVQAYTPGFAPPEPGKETQLFACVVVFSFAAAVDVERLQRVASTCFAAKSGPDAGPLAPLRRMLITGDTAFERTAFHVPADLAGDDRTYASTILFQRDRDLDGGFLGTAAQPILAHPDRPEHVCPVPAEHWVSARSRELLGRRRTLS